MGEMGGMGGGRAENTAAGVAFFDLATGNELRKNCAMSSETSRSSHSSHPPGKQILSYKPYEKLLSYRRSNAVYLATVKFTERFLRRGDHTIDQMVQAARSGKQNIVEGSMSGAGSRQSELFLTNVARASLAELLEDYKDYLNVHRQAHWAYDSREAVFVRNLCARCAPQCFCRFYFSVLFAFGENLLRNIPGFISSGIVI